MQNTRQKYVLLILLLHKTQSFCILPDFSCIAHSQTVQQVQQNHSYKEKKQQEYHVTFTWQSIKRQIRSFRFTCDEFQYWDERISEQDNIVPLRIFFEVNVETERERQYPDDVYRHVPEECPADFLSISVWTESSGSRPKISKIMSCISSKSLQLRIINLLCIK